MHMEFIIKLSDDGETTKPRAVIFENEITPGTREAIFSSLQPGVYRYVRDPSIEIRQGETVESPSREFDLSAMLPEISMPEKKFKTSIDADLTEKTRHPYLEPVVNEKTTPRRNDACPCGSGKKYKHCHLNK